MILPQDTGERILLAKESPLMVARHLSAYIFASQYVAGRSVLDIACGEGYGSGFLADSARTVSGLDYSAQAISYAREKYRRDNLFFRELDVKELRCLREKFQVICAFQFIEHLRDANIFLEDVKPLLTEGGVFICSTPNKHDASPGSLVPCNKFHLKEYDLDEFRSLLQSHFTRVELWGLQRTVKLAFYLRLKKSGLCNILPAGVDPVKRFFGRLNPGNFEFKKNGLQNALDFLAVCRI